MRLRYKRPTSPPLVSSRLVEGQVVRSHVYARMALKSGSRSHDRTVRVMRCGRICLGSRKVNLSTSLAEQLVRVREVDDQVWLVSFLEYDLGYFDRDEDRVETGPSPFAPDTVLTMCPE